MDRLAVCWAHTLLLLVGVSSFAAGTPVPPPPTQFVSDSANFISPATRRTLEQRLESYERQTGHQLLVWIGRTTGDVPVEDWANEAFKSWRIGRKGIDDGLAVFVLADDRKIRIEVGYGLEGVVPDAKAARIIREVMLPRIRSGDRDGAIVAGVDELISAIGGADQRAPVAPDYRQRPAQRQASPLEIAFCALVAVGLLAFLITHPALALFLFSTMFSGRGRGYGGGGFGGGGGGGGGFSGGGGSSGGGGATGSW